MLAELKMIHNMLRDNLDLVDQLVHAADNGVDAIEIQGQVAVLTGVSGLRKLQVNCLSYCRIVHGHHGLEDVAMLRHCSRRRRLLRLATHRRHVPASNGLRRRTRTSPLRPPRLSAPRCGPSSAHRLSWLPTTAPRRSLYPQACRG